MQEQNMKEKTLEELDESDDQKEQEDD